MLSVFQLILRCSIIHCIFDILIFFEKTYFFIFLSFLLIYLCYLFISSTSFLTLSIIILFFSFPPSLNIPPICTVSPLPYHRASLWSSCVVLPLLALTWMSAVLAMTDRRSILFQVLFAVFNSVQGCVIITVHCFLRREVKICIH